MGNNQHQHSIYTWADWDALEEKSIGTFQIRASGTRFSLNETTLPDPHAHTSSSKALSTNLTGSMANPSAFLDTKVVSGDVQRPRTDESIDLRRSDVKLPAMMQRLRLNEPGSSESRVKPYFDTSSTGEKSVAVGSLRFCPSYEDDFIHMKRQQQQPSPHIRNAQPVFIPKSTDYMSRSRERSQYIEKRFAELAERKDLTAADVDVMIAECKQLWWIDSEEHRDYLTNSGQLMARTVEEKVRKCRERKLAELNREREFLMNSLPPHCCTGGYSKTPGWPCAFCNQFGHHNSLCSEVPLNAERIELLKKERRCFKCLAINHTTSECRSKKQCYYCKAYPSDHNQAICPRRPDTGTGGDYSNDQV